MPSRSNARADGVHHRPFKYPHVFSVSLVSFPPSSPPQHVRSDSSCESLLTPNNPLHLLYTSLWQPIPSTRHHTPATTQVVSHTSFVYFQLCSYVNSGYGHAPLQVSCRHGSSARHPLSSLNTRRGSRMGSPRLVRQKHSRL